MIISVESKVDEMCTEGRVFSGCSSSLKSLGYTYNSTLYMLELYGRL